MADRYKIVRHYQKGNIRKRTIETGLTLEEAQKHCEDPNTSSSTCQTSSGRALAKKVGAWFDGYERM